MGDVPGRSDRGDSYVVGHHICHQLLLCSMTTMASFPEGAGEFYLNSIRPVSSSVSVLSQFFH